jgi:hypothetical protein
MLKETFTVEELTILEMYKAPKLEQTKEEISKALPIIDNEDMKKLAKSVLSKLDLLSSNEFKQLDFTNALSKDNVKYEFNPLDDEDSSENFRNVYNE